MSDKVAGMLDFNISVGLLLLFLSHHSAYLSFWLGLDDFGQRGLLMLYTLLKDFWIVQLATANTGCCDKNESISKFITSMDLIVPDS